MIRFACPGCNASFTVADEKAGKSGKCPKCQSQFVIPAATASGPAPTKTATPPDDDLPVEIQPCPKCKTRLSVMPSDIGLDIECTNCQTVFKALKAGGSAPRSDSKSSRPPVDDEDDRPAKKGRSSRRDEDEDEDDRPKRKSRRDEDEDDEDRPAKKSSRRRDDDDEEERPSKRGSRRGDDDDEDEDDRPRKYKKKKRSGGGGSAESKKTVAGLLGLLLGAWGVHKFYLGYSTAGIIQIVVTLVTCGAGGIIGVIEGIIYLTKTDEDFIDTYQRNEKQWF